MTSGRARIQPIRSPPQTDLLSDPIDTAPGASAANGTDRGPAKRRSLSVSSTTATQLAWLSAAASRSRPAPVRPAPVGLCTSGMTYASAGLDVATISASPRASPSPSGPGASTSAVPRARRTDSALG
jgi:hypothetical protein